eukprot:10220593-Prorocentrum_lima.AAC.1
MPEQAKPSGARPEQANEQTESGWRKGALVSHSGDENPAEGEGRCRLSRAGIIRQPFRTNSV